MTDNLLVYKKEIDDKYIFLRDVLSKKMGLSRSLLAKLKQQHKIYVNGRWTLSSYKLQAGDIVTVDLTLNEENHITPREFSLDIIYEDPDFLVINKPPGLAVHPTRDPDEITLAHAVACYWVQQGVSRLFRAINRLDKNTSGLVLIGKSQFAHQAVFTQMKQGRLKRSYLALVEGILQDDSGFINLPVAHPDPDSSPRRSVSITGKEAFTEYMVLKRYGKFTLVGLTLGSGRTHQIRVHMSHIGHPVCGDTLYGTPSPFITRQALHACQMSLFQPRTGSHLKLEAPLPIDIASLLERIK